MVFYVDMVVVFMDLSVKVIFVCIYCENQFNICFKVSIICFQFQFMILNFVMYVYYFEFFRFYSLRCEY